MADNGMWFKLWIGAEDDPDLGNLSLENFARWCKFGLYMKKHGTGGTVVLKAPCFPLQYKFRVDSFQAVIDTIKSFPNCLISTGRIAWPHGLDRDPETDGVWMHVPPGLEVCESRGQDTVTGVTNATVTWKNWQRYQGDNSSERVRKFRANETAKKRREEKRINTPPTPLFVSEDFGVEELIDLYNSSVPSECTKVVSRSPARKKKAKQYLAIFPKREFWEQVFKRVHESKFLRGLSGGTDAHRNFRFDFDWMLTRGQDGSENVVKVYEGKYSDSRATQQERKFVG